MKYILCQIQAHGRNIHFGLLLFGSMVANTLHRGASDADYEVGGDYYIALRGLILRAGFAHSVDIIC